MLEFLTGLRAEQCSIVDCLTQYRTMLHCSGMFHCAEALQMAPAGAVQLAIGNMGEDKTMKNIFSIK